MASTSDRTPSPACVLKPQRQKTRMGNVIQTDFVNIPSGYHNHIFVSSTKACFLGRKPSPAKVLDDFKACLPESWQSVSALHCILRYKDGKFTIEDKSSNGTWVGKPGKGAGSSEEDFRRLEKGKQEEVAMDSFVMLAQWPTGRKAEDVLTYRLVALPSDLKAVREKPRDQPAPMFGVSGLLGKAAGGTGKIEPCKNCKTQAAEALQAKEQLAAEKSKHEKTKKEKDKLDKELYSTKQEVDRMRVAASNATKAAETDKRNAEQAAQAKLSKVEAEVTAAKIQCRELTASRDQLRLGVTPLLSTVRKLAAQNSANRVAIAGLDEQQAADVKAMDDVLKNHTIKGSSDVNEQEEEILALQKELRRVEREAAAWRLKAEAYATKLPDELNNVLNSHLPNLVQECIQKVHSRVITLNSATASQLFGPEISAGLALTQGGGGGDEERALGPDYSQRTVVSSHHGGGGTPDLLTPMTGDGDPALRSQGADRASLSLRGMVNASQAPSPGGHVVVGPTGKAGRASQAADDGPNGSLKRSEAAAEGGQQGEGKRRRVGSGRGGSGAKDDFPENRSQVNVNANGKSTGEGKSAGGTGGEKAEQAASSQGKNKAGGDTSDKSDLVKRLAALPKSHNL